MQNGCYPWGIARQSPVRAQGVNRRLLFFTPRATPENIFQINLIAHQFCCRHNIKRENHKHGKEEVSTQLYYPRDVNTRVTNYSSISTLRTHFINKKNNNLRYKI
jgi:hypothetical protein